MNRSLIVPPLIVNDTILELQAGGRKGQERVVLWLGCRSDNGIVITEYYVPEQKADWDFFRIPRNGVARLLNHLRLRQLMIGAQVHSHPEEAFHSAADDTWAIVRHVGALSFVLPYFAMGTDVKNFQAEAAVFRLRGNDTWAEVPPQTINRYYWIE